VKGRWIRAAIVVSTIAVVGAFVAGPAGATPPSGYGFDDTSHVVVGGGSDTTYYTNQLLGDDWAHSDFGNTGGCTVNTAVPSALNECIASGAETSDLGNWQHDTFTNANPVGSSAGIASLNGISGVTYGGTVNNGGNVDFARSSRGPKTSGSADCSGGNELACDTFWGFGQDGIQITVFGSRVGDTTNSTALSNHAITPTELYHIFNCDYATWSQVPSLGITPGASNDGPIVPWGMNTSSGTFATFQSYIQGQSGVPAGWSPDAPNGTTNTGVGTIDSYTHKVGCERQLSNGIFPFENDMKPLVNDPASISTNPLSVNDPVNWITWSSFGVLSSFPYLSQPTRSVNPGSGTAFTTGPTPVNGSLPSTSKIHNNTWAIGRTLFHVTRKTDADCPTTGTACDFTGNPGPTSNTAGTNDLNVVGGSSGVTGAVREFTRWLCRPGPSVQQNDPITGVNYDSEITGALSASGFTTVPTALQTPGTRCDVVH
jgi:ABC-type phosphate transport system substrate-binding protein